MRTVTVTEARATWSRLLADAARGETIIITRRGHPVALLTPPSTGKYARAIVATTPEPQGRQDSTDGDTYQEG